MIEQLLGEILVELRKISNPLICVPAPTLPAFIPVAPAVPVELPKAQDTVSQVPAPVVGTPVLIEVPVDTPLPITREQCSNALIALATSKGREVAAAVLKVFGGTKLADVKEADYSKFYAAITEAGK